MNRIVVLLICCAGLLIRVPHLGDPPLRFHPTRQYRSAIMARGYYLPHDTALSSPQRAAADIAARQQLLIEPPLLEHAAAAVYRLIGREQLAAARLLAVIIWMAGAAFLWWLVAELFASSASLAAALAVMLFLPYGIAASQAFQPDGLMTSSMLLAVAATTRHDRVRRWGSLIFAVTAIGAAVFVKPMALFFVLPVWLALVVRRRGWLRGVTSSAVVAAISALPAVLWYALEAPGVTEDRFFPQLLRTSAFWSGWFHLLDRVALWPLVAVALVGAIVARGRSRVILAALWTGYAVFGLTFTYHIHTHDYYSLPVIPVVALSLAAVVDAIDRRLASASTRRVWGWLGVAGLTLAFAASIRAAGVLHADDAAETAAADYVRIGELVGHSPSVVALDDSYAFSLNYHGYLAATNLPLGIDNNVSRMAGRPVPTAEEEVAALKADFLIATVQFELDNQGLAPLLDRRYQVIDRGGSAEHWRYVVYDLRNAKASVVPESLSFFELTDGTRASTSTVSMWQPANRRWHVVSPAPDLFDVQPAAGVGPATLTLLPRKQPAEIERAVSVDLLADGGTTPLASIKVHVRAMANMPPGAPSGAVDAPAEPIVLGAGPIVFQGWAVDTFDLRRVRVAGTDANGKTIPLGETRGSWMRDDVAKLLPAAHDIFNSGWTLTVQPVALANAARPVTVHVYAESGDGRTTEIGRRTIRN